MCDMSVSNFVKPCLKGNRLSIKILKEAHEARLECYMNNLHGISVTSKDNMSTKASELCDKLMIL